jgi:hypothetical protein
MRIGAAIDGKKIGQGIGQGALAGAVGGATLGALNIAAMGPAIHSGSFGYNKPVYRSGGLLTLHLQKGEGIAIGRNLVVKESGQFSKDAPLRFHEYTHFLQQRKLGSPNFYARGLKEYYQSGKGDGKWWNTYDTPGHLEHQSEILESFFKYYIFRFLKR